MTMAMTRVMISKLLVLIGCTVIGITTLKAQAAYAFAPVRTTRTALIASPRCVRPVTILGWQHFKNGGRAFVSRTTDSALFETNEGAAAEGQKSGLPMLLDPGTKGGALFLSLVLFVIPLVGYGFVTEVLGVDSIEAGKWIGVGFTFATLVLWVSTYIFRVATKDMTYVSVIVQTDEVCRCPDEAYMMCACMRYIERHMERERETWRERERHGSMLL